jgi:hypothetical protein
MGQLECSLLRIQWSPTEAARVFDAQGGLLQVRVVR